MLLYYFTSLRHGLSAIQEERLKVSRFDQLNDLYDHVGIFVNNENDLHAREELRSQVLAQEGLLCMSKTYQEPLLWGHYADNHRGMCLIFSVLESGDWWDVEYVPKRPKVRDFGIHSFRDLSKEQIHTIARTKFKNWSYEQEMRRLIFLDEYDFADDIHFQRFDYQMRLKGALFGARCGISDRQLQALLAHDESLKYAFVMPREGSYRVGVSKHKTAEKVIPEGRRLRADLGGNIKFDKGRSVKIGKNYRMTI